MKVLLLGAGASKGAGYPLANQLLAAIETDAQDSRLVQLREAWQAWREFRDNVTSPSRLLIRNPNPEVILSLLDLYDTALIVHDNDRLARAARAMSEEIQAAGDEPDGYWDSAERQALLEGRVARNRLLDCLREYFDAKHSDDGKLEHRGRRDYLRRRLGQLEAGDLVVTLNWDTTVERTLAEEDRWHPTTGYGFTKELCIGTSSPEAGEPRRAAPSRVSEISVLKLHGSAGWYSNRRGELYFRHPSYLQCFSFEKPLVDPREPPPGSGPPEGSVLMYPSYLKQLKSHEMQSVWHHTARGLEKAHHVEIWGYSLPESDTAVRVLLNPLRFRLDAGSVAVDVHDPNPEVQERWREFLGPHARIDGQRF